jgi:hypothetical protein
MEKAARPAFVLSTLLFIVFVASVVGGAFSLGFRLSDVSEMLTLFTSVICFVVGILGKEAAVTKQVRQQKNIQGRNA